MPSLSPPPAPPPAVPSRAPTPAWLLWTARVCMWSGNAAGVVMLVAVVVTLAMAGEPGSEAITMLAGGVWFATGGWFIGAGRGVPMLLLGRVRVGGLVGIIAEATDGSVPVREGVMVRSRGAVFAMAGGLMTPLGLGLAVSATLDLLA